jgi:hypothetical protein
MKLASQGRNRDEVIVPFAEVPLDRQQAGE